jgi:hypothetical protein
METLTGRFGLTVMVIAFEVAGLLVAQLRFEVKTQVMILPLVGVNINVGLLLPWFPPFTFH